jgi:glutaredoxin-like protein
MFGLPERESAPLRELAALSPRIVLQERVDRAAAGLGPDELPALLLSGAARGRVRFLGAPTGLEFGTLLQSLVDVASGASGLRESTRQALRGLARDVHIRVFVTSGCPHCPRLARLAHRMAVECSSVTADVIDADALPELAARLGVDRVPTVVLNGRLEFQGARPESRFLERVLRAAA